MFIGENEYFSGAALPGHFLLFGHPVAHSISPEIHACLFSLRGRDESYFSADITPSHFCEAVRSLPCDIYGFNCTIPHKECVMPLLAHIDRTAALIGAVNTVVRKSNELEGYNTDMAGFSGALEHYGIPIKHSRMLVLGSGGTAKTLAAAGLLSGADVTVAARNADKAQALAAELLNSIGKEIHIVPFSECSGSYDLIANATPVGMFPNENDSPVCLSAFSGVKYVFDSIYNPPKTRLLQQAGAHGAIAVNGLLMLCIQAARAQELWFPAAAPFAAAEITAVYDRALSVLACRRLREARGKDNIILSGFMGCGKTTVGSILAKALGLSFIDMDEEIEGRFLMPVSKIFADKGEDAFRRAEQEIAQNLSARKGLVIASGGGALMHPDTAAALKSNGLNVFLKSSPDKLAARLLSLGDTRPLIKNNTAADIKTLYAARLPIYEAHADLIILADGNPAAICNEILTAV